MALTVEIATVDRTSKYEKGTLRLSEKLDLRTTATFQIIDTSYTPVLGDDVEITDGATTHFKGIIQKVKSKLLLDGATTRYVVTCGDYSYVFQSRLVADAYTSQTLSQIILDIIADKFPNEGITTTNVETGPTIDKVAFNYVYAADAFDQLADLTGYHWYVDTDKDLHFEERSSSTAGFDQTDASSNFLAGSLDHTTDKKRYRNCQIARAGTDLTIARTETIDGIGNRVYSLVFPCGIEPTIRIDIGAGFVSQTIGVRGEDTGMDWYWLEGEHEITQDDGGTVLDGTDQIEVVYRGQFPIVVESRHETEIADRVSVEGGDGLYDNVVSEPDVDTVDAATSLTNGLLRRYGTISETVRYQTDGAGLRSGQLQTITLAAHGISNSYLITEISATDLGAGAGGYLRYTVSAVAGEYVGGWEKFFQNIIRGGRKFLLRENEVVSVLRVISTGNEVELEETAASNPTASPETRCGFALVGYSEAG